MIQKEPLKQKLRAYVDEQIPKLRTVSVADLESMGETFKPEDLMDATTLEAQEIVDSFRLSLVTESLTEEYSKTFLIGARKYGADWLENYISGFWEPDENDMIVATYRDFRDCTASKWRMNSGGFDNEKDLSFVSVDLFSGAKVTRCF